jgi:uncharacterized protein YecT (DUF1311 family)
MLKMKFTFVFLVFSILALPVFAKDLPDSIKGKWEVAEVNINTEASRAPFYAWNDPRLVGRIFTFSPDQISNDTPENFECLTPWIKIAVTDSDELIKKSMAGYGYPAIHADAKAYQLDLGRDRNPEIMQVYCKDKLWNGNLGAERNMQGSWLFLTDGNRILLRWYDETILVLDRISSNQKPNPSFDCLKSSTDVENEICHSIELSSFDRSVSEAYKLALSQYRDASNDFASFMRGQKTWLAARNTCGADNKCILASMKKRLDELSALSQ